MKVFIASDHAGVSLKRVVVEYLQKLKDEVDDLGPHTEERIDYPVKAGELIARMAQCPSARGILICGTGIGMSMAANRYRGIRAALCYGPEQAALSRGHNDSNVLCLGAGVTSESKAVEIVKAWRESKFEGGRHARRLALFDDLGVGASSYFKSFFKDGH